ncbi:MULTISPECIES: DsbA family oxidoreductase [Brochothrix]|uniref:DsbA family oxidoreductase n=1 Tax=Brochothrix TaxID=2755 RepID=UPI002580DBBE|nr:MULTISPECIES: DsbA family oxidoreductase [Brochothrix]MBR5526201.1 DsbA family oxidoreductase [Brochothrix sp.]WKK69840.1 DsbA family oxidoreductase [Brochothrix thermosphacta]
MKVEIWSDYACPFCYIGKRNFEAAVDGDENIEVSYRSFELDPTAPAEKLAPLREMLSEKYNVSVEEADAMNANVINMAKQAGLDYDFDHIKPTNTLKMHRLSHYAREEGKEAELTEKGLDAYFTKGAYLNDNSTLLELADAAGLDSEKAEAVLRSDAYTKGVRDDQQRARDLGISGVPFFLFDGKYAVSGAQPTAQFKAVIQQIKEKEKIVQPEKLIPDAADCADGSCNI